MKKYVFIIALLLVVISAAVGHWAQAGTVFAAMFLWLAYENWLRTRFRFLRGKGFDEFNFDLGAEPAQIEIAADASCAIFATLDSMLSMRDSRGRELWRRPTEPGILALLPVSGGACYYALADEIVLCGRLGNVEARLSFTPPPFKQSYRLALSGDGQVLMLHTPWFLQFSPVGLSALGQRIACEDTGHYMKYVAISHSGSRVFFAGAKLLEEEQSAQARWGSWTQQQGQWRPDWADALESYGNSHLRGVAISHDEKTLALELYQERYEVRILNSNGSLRFRKEGLERPVMSPDASCMLWESQADGLVLGDGVSLQKYWSHPCSDKIRHKALGASGESAAIEGRRLAQYGLDGALRSEAWFESDPFRMASSADGFSLAIVRQQKGAMLRLRAS